MVFPLFGAENSKNIDVLLLIDNSGSMRQSDPNNLRWVGGQLLVDILKEGDRVGVISFNAAPNLVVPMAEVGAPGEKERIKDIFKEMSSRGGTDLLEALDLASTTIEQDASKNTHAIIMSDGVVDLSDTAGAAVDTEEYMQGLDEKSTWFKERGISVSGISFSRSDKEVLEPFVTATGGRYYYVEDQAELVPLYYKIIANASARDVDDTSSMEKSVNIPPEVEQVIITCTGSGADDAVLLDPDGREVTASAQVQVITADYYKIFRINSPLAGIWEVDFANQDIEVLVETDVAEGVQPFGELKYEKLPLEEKVLLQVTAGAVENPTDRSAELKFTPSDGSVPLMLPLYDDGTHGDEVKGDNIFSLEYTFTRPGDFKVTALVYQDRKPAGVWTGSRTVRALPSIQVLNTTDRFHKGLPAQLQVDLLFKGSRVTDHFAVKAIINGENKGTKEVALNDSGEGGDLKANDGIYSGEWIPGEKGKYIVQYLAAGIINDEEERLRTDPQEVLVVDPPTITLTENDVRWRIFEPSVLNISLTFHSTSLKREQVVVGIDQEGWILNRKSFWVTPGVSTVGLFATKMRGAENLGEGLTLRLESDVPLEGESILLNVPMHLETFGIVGGVLLVGAVVIRRLTKRERLSGMLVFDEPHGSRVVDLKHFKKSKTKLTYWPGETEYGVSEKKEPVVLSLKRQRTKEALSDGDILLTVEQGELYGWKDGSPELVDQVYLSDGLELVGEDLSLTFLDWSSDDMEKRTELDRRLSK